MQADHTPLIASFFNKSFIEPNERIINQSTLIAKLEDMLYQLQDSDGEAKFPRNAAAYLDEWAQNDKGWLRKFYPLDSDEPHFDLTPAAEKALVWLEGLTERQFIGTESRLLIIFELLHQMVSGVETDAEIRIAELETRKAAIEREIASIRAGEMNIMDDTALKDRFLQVSTTARELLSDFRAVEHNFRELDRLVREQIAAFDGNKGEMLQQIFGERDAITDSDQGKSFRAFWDFLMSSSSQEELTSLLEHVFNIDALADYTVDHRLKRIHFDWLEHGLAELVTYLSIAANEKKILFDESCYEPIRWKDSQGIEREALLPRIIFNRV